MDLSPWDPWRELERIRRESNEIWNQFLNCLRPREPDRDAINFLPDVDVIETRDDYRVFISLPGFVEEDIEISVSGTSLTVRGERYPPYDRPPGQNALNEWRYGYFERSIPLPQPIDVGQLKAAYDAGVLTIVVAK